MFSFSKLFFLALLTSTEATFQRDVLLAGKVRNDFSKEALDKQMADPKSDLHRDLLAKALPIAQFEKKYGVHLQSDGDGSSSSEHRSLQDGDYEMISFSGYSLKFAKCQPVQYFSERALQMGEHSPMVTSDIVILRLCPTSSCSTSVEYGCSYNFSEYAMELSDYLQIMLQYGAAKRDYMCSYCNTCLLNERRLEEDGGQQQGQNDQNQNNNNQQQEGGQQAEDGQQAEEGQEVAEEQEVVEEQAESDYAATACSGWSTYCGDYETYCVEQEQQGEVYLNYESYQNYLHCSQLNYNNYAYFVKPRCDGYQRTIKMGIFYDKYCSQYAGNEVSLKNTGMGFKENAFQEFYSSTCVDCSESQDTPPYDAASKMCNGLHYTAAKCTDDMAYNLFGENQADDSTECSYIESIRFGTYNEVGQLTTRYADGSYAEKMTQGQEILLGISIAISVALVVYACYLHHAMTNLLIKSLSHRELLPPSRHASRSRVSPTRRSGRRLKKVGGNDPDWDEDEEENGGQYA